MSDSNKKFDTIIIGSGIGGLTTAALLARLENQSVLVLEQHHTLGGFTHSFDRQSQYSWDVGVHYVGSMTPGSPSRKLMDFVSEERLDWTRLPDPHDIFIYPGESFGVPSNRKAYRDKLVDRFPGEETAIDNYFQQVKKAKNWYRLHMMAQSFSKPLSWPLDGYNWLNSDIATRTTEDVVSELTDNKKLQSLLVTNWGDYGLLPSESSFAVHSIVTASYFDGAYYPVGGSESIAASIVPTIESAGGTCLTNRQVSNILVKNDRAIGVQINNENGDNSDVYHADTIISNAGSHNTYRRLLSDVENKEVADIVSSLENFEDGRSFVTLYLGLEESPEPLGIEGENYWVNTSWDQNGDSLNPFEVLRGNPSFCFLSFGPENDPEADYSTAQVITMAPYDAFESWADESWPRRSGNYKQLKKRIGDGLLELAEEAVPGLSDLVDFREVSTPLSIEHFTGHQKGAPYGIPAIPERYSSRVTGVETPIQNLYLTGADAGSPGVMGAAFGGLFSAARATKELLGPLKALKIIR